jgi:hypothetical protein
MNQNNESLVHPGSLQAVCNTASNRPVNETGREFSDRVTTSSPANLRGHSPGEVTTRDTVAKPLVG